MKKDDAHGTYAPNVFINESGRLMGYDLFSRLFRDRIVYLGGPIDMQTADVMIAQLLSLESKNKKQEITMYINSPGGDVVAGLAIVDTMEHIACPVSTLAVGLAASMGAFILAHGDHQRRFALPHATIMIHQPSGGVHGQATDIEIQAEHMLLVRDRLNVMLAERTGHSVEKIKRDTERDKFMSAIQALEYGLIDEIMQPKKEK